MTQHIMSARSVSALLKLIAGFLVLAIAHSNLANAETTSHKTKWNVRFGVIPVGKATFKIEFDDETYSMSASGKTVGVAEMVSPGRGRAKSSGLITGDKVMAIQHEAIYIEEKKKKNKKSTLEMDFEDGAVKTVSIEPKKKKRKKKGRKWVQIQEEQLSSVIDPGSSIIVPVAPENVKNPRAVCNRVLNVYDGDTRFDIKLKYKYTKTISTEGYDGDAFVCQLRYVPVSGHKKNQKNINYMRDNEGIEIWLAPMENSSLFTPIRIEVPTWIGKFTAIPVFFGSPAK
ncbi:MAG: DUF3108 domain-containing protein [Pseudomonadota bacterium]